ncbi:major capsid protein [Rhizobium phage RHph_TM3_14A]|nr:major capsid protein [Rhizobium phage RHph_TM27A]QIG66932.1 major capsid protein [Rhizobium phage RHph_TM27B]QIG67022.1 major capsid protein [Rhizobium phage RHph_TM29]QIG67477.1 major capsid protein [Rhizobium phage RHph_TM3_14A]
MTFPVASGVTTPPIYPTGSAGNGLKAAGFIPEIWSGKLIEKFYAATVLAAISNTDYEGEIKNHGDTVHIRTKPTITIKDYRADGLLELERPKGNLVDLLIDKGKYFNTILDDVMEVQSDLNNMSMWSDDASEQMKIVVDTEVLTGLLNQAAAVNRGATAGKVSGDINLGVTGTPLAVVPDNAGVGEVDVIDVILRLGQTLDEQNIPEQGRWIIIPTWLSTYIKKSELRQAYLSGDAVSMLRNGRIGMVDRFTVYVSNLLPQGVAAGLAAGESAVYAGHAHGLTFASQINNVESMRSEMTFGTILRGLQVYGWKVIDNVALAQAIVTKA